MSAELLEQDTPSKPTGPSNKGREGPIFGIESKYSNLVGDSVTIGDICGYIREERVRLIEVMRHLTKDDYPINTLSQDTLLAALTEQDDTVVSTPDFNLKQVNNMSPREWRMLLGIIGGAASYLHKKNIPTKGLDCVLKKVGELLDSHIPEAVSPMYGWTVPEYNGDGQVVGYVKPSYSK